MRRRNRAVRGFVGPSTIGAATVHANPAARGFATTARSPARSRAIAASIVAPSGVRHAHPAIATFTAASSSSTNAGAGVADCFEHLTYVVRTLLEHRPYIVRTCGRYGPSARYEHRTNRNPRPSRRPPQHDGRVLAAETERVRHQCLD